jgi:hypothetical protein
MKKLLTCFFALLLGSMLIRAQAEEPEKDVLRTKKGVPILPQKGDWAIGIDATPFFRYLGNIFTSNNNPYYPAFGFTAQQPGAIYGKYRVSESTAYRGSLLIGISNDVERSRNTTNPDQVDRTITSAVSIGLTAGIEKNRQVFGRLAGIYGVQAGLMKEPYNAGAYLGKRHFKDASDSNNNYRLTGGNTYSLLAGGFVGVEFYLAPRIALAGEFGYNVRFYMQGDRKYVPEAGSTTIQDYGAMGLGFAPSQSGNLQLLFYF